jgi:hypothetical protein
MLLRLSDAGLDRSRPEISRRVFGELGERPACGQRGFGSTVR